MCHKYNIIFRDCIRFAFMDILQGELDEIRCLWNTHPMVKARTGHPICGIPDELFYIPEIHGIYSIRSVRCAHSTFIDFVQVMKTVLALLMRKTLISVCLTELVSLLLYLMSS